MQEYNSWVYSDDDSMEKATWTADWIQTLSDLSVRFGKPMNVAALHKKWIAEAGFVDVKEEVCKVRLVPSMPTAAQLYLTFRCPLALGLETQSSKSSATLSAHT